MIDQLILNGLISGSIYALVAIGFSLVLKISRFLNFAHGGVYTLAGYFTFLLIATFRLEPSVAFPIVCILTVLVGCSIEFSVYRPLRKRNASSSSLLIASLGIYLALQNLISLFWGNDTKTIRAASIVEGHRLMGARITTVQIMIVVVTLIATAGLVALFKTNFGRALRAVANDLDLAESVGIQTDRMILGAFAVSSLLAAVAAMLLCFEMDLTPTSGFKLLVMAIVATIVGGLRNLVGAAIGGFTLGIAQNLAVWKLPTKWQDCIAFALLVGCLLLRPTGFAGGSFSRRNVSG